MTENTEICEIRPKFRRNFEPWWSPSYNKDQLTRERLPTNKTHWIPFDYQSSPSDPITWLPTHRVPTTRLPRPNQIPSNQEEVQATLVREHD
uniref:Uncharacterized protein n=1 Tax=Arundo donax TaxID=35708 RepID=A0A0A9CCL9_ARUDO